MVAGINILHETMIKPTNLFFLFFIFVKTQFIKTRMSTRQIMRRRIMRRSLVRRNPSAAAVGTADKSADKSAGKSVDTEEADIPSPSEWGPKLWFMMDLGIVNMEQKSVSPKSLATFYSTLSAVIPCEGCRTHYTALIKSSPPDVSSIDGLKNWLRFVKVEVGKNVTRMQKEADAADAAEAAAEKAAAAAAATRAGRNAVAQTARGTNSKRGILMHAPKGTDGVIQPVIKRRAKCACGRK
jgi:hypothetical protein